MNQKNFIFIIVILIMGLFLNGCTTQSPTHQAPHEELPVRSVRAEIKNVSVVPKGFDPAKGDEVEIIFTLTKDAQISLHIYDADDYLVRTIKDDKVLEPGKHKFRWDGRDEAGKLVPDEAYTYTIIARHASGKEFIYDPSEQTGGIKLEAQDISYDAETGQIKYALPKAARVRIRIGYKEGGPLILTLVDWVPRPAGKNMEIWTGWDKSYVVPFKDHPRRRMILESFSLPDNCVITRGSGMKAIYPVYAKSSIVQKRRRMTENRENIPKKHRHYNHERAVCHEPRFRIEFPNAARNEDGIPEVKGIVPVRIILNEQDKKHLIDTRYEVMIYVDGIFVFEDEEGISPYTYQLNTKGIQGGEHVLNVNIQDYEEHVGSMSMKFIVKR